MLQLEKTVHLIYGGPVHANNPNPISPQGSSCPYSTGPYKIFAVHAPIGGDCPPSMPKTPKRTSPHKAHFGCPYYHHTDPKTWLKLYWAVPLIE